MRITTKTALIIFAMLFAYTFVYIHTYELSVGKTPAMVSQESVMRGIIDTWQSNDNPNLTRQFKDSEVIDRVKGATHDTIGRWLVFTKDSPDGFYQGGLDSNAVYLSIAVSSSERMYYRVDTLDDKVMRLYSLRDGREIVFTREP